MCGHCGNKVPQLGTTPSIQPWNSMHVHPHNTLEPFLIGFQTHHVYNLLGIALKT